MIQPAHDTANAVLDPARLRALREACLVDTPVEKEFDRHTRLATRTIHAPVSLVSLVGADRQFFKSEVGLAEPWASARETPLSHSFCQYVVASRSPLVIDDARTHPVLHTNLAIRDLGVIAYAGMPLITKGGQVLGSFCVIDTKPRDWTSAEVEIIRDLAACVMTEIELRAAVREAQEASRSKSEFLATMSHELRTPLNAIIGFGELLRENVIESEADRQQALTDISESGEHLLALINDILDLAKIEAGRLELDLGETELPDLFASTLTLLRERASMRGIQISADCGDVTTILADTRKLKQILFNLATNAVKFTPEGGSIHLAAQVVADGVALSVTDNGIGIDLEDQGRLFQEFTQVDSSLSRRHEGTGLGLALTRRLVELHGGTISVRSAPGEDSTFTAWLPQSLRARGAASSAR
jgi:signal transduction histidine kinase